MTTEKIRLSVIIPLEFHRGLAERCIAAWSRGQTYPRECYQIVIVAPDTCSEKQLRAIRAALHPADRLLVKPLHHDMPLVAAGAAEAEGAAFFFTEAHCLPEPDTLEQAAQILAERPDWAGFSGRSIPITHNLLSEIEAEMYDAHIRENLLNHSWLKVLDQCLVLRREPYFSCGGLEPEYGHFAEWVIAARLHHGGQVVGYDARAAIRHYYIGELHELEEFTEDFSGGEMRFHARHRHGPWSRLLPVPEELTRAGSLCPEPAPVMLRLLVRD
ncbi:MAG TPA: hypothetical protein VIS74_08280, partial [Chthoniobacterales bacterium]